MNAQIRLLIISVTSAVVIVISAYASILIRKIYNHDKEISSLLKDKGFEVTLNVRAIPWKIVFADSNVYFNISSKDDTECDWSVAYYNWKDKSYLVYQDLEKITLKVQKDAIPMSITLPIIDLQKKQRLTNQ